MIKFEDVISVSKKNSVILIPNAIEIATQQSKVILISNDLSYNFSSSFLHLYTEIALIQCCENIII